MGGFLKWPGKYFTRTTQPIQEWVCDPVRAADNAAALEATGALPGPRGSYTFPFQRFLDAEPLQEHLARLESAAGLKHPLKKLLRR